MGNCRAQFFDGEEQKMEVGKLGNDVHGEIRTLTGGALPSKFGQVSRQLALSATQPPQKMWVADVLELGSDVPCSDGTIFKRIEDGGHLVDWKTRTGA